MSVYSSKLSATISRASSWSSTIRMRFFSLLEFIIPFVSSSYTVCLIKDTIERSSCLWGPEKSAQEVGKIGRCHGGVCLLVAFKSPHGSQCFRRQASIGGEFGGLQGVALYSS